MIRQASHLGLIVSAGAVPRAIPLQELVSWSGWPTLFEATALLLRRELLLHMPRLALFWLEHEEDVAATAKLVAWLRLAEPTVRRAAVGYWIDGEAELAVRSAGAQLFVPVSESLRYVLESSILPLLDGESPPADVAADLPKFRAAPAVGRRRSTTTPDSLRKHMHPP